MPFREVLIIPPINNITHIHIYIDIGNSPYLIWGERLLIDTYPMRCTRILHISSETKTNMEGVFFLTYEFPFKSRDIYTTYYSPLTFNFFREVFRFKIGLFIKYLCQYDDIIIVIGGGVIQVWGLGLLKTG